MGGGVEMGKKVRENFKGSCSVPRSLRDDDEAFKVGCSAAWIGARWWR